jgi:hypothetical protein
MDKIYYVMGGVLTTSGGKKEFSLVKPSGHNALPYVSISKSGNLWKGARHHSHEYMVNPDLRTLILSRFSEEAYDVPAPEQVTLSGDLIVKLKEAIQSNKVMK